MIDKPPFIQHTGWGLQSHRAPHSPAAPRAAETPAGPRGGLQALRDPEGDLTRDFRSEPRPPPAPSLPSPSQPQPAPAAFVWLSPWTACHRRVVRLCWLSALLPPGKQLCSVAGAV